MGFEVGSECYNNRHSIGVRLTPSTSSGTTIREQETSVRRTPPLSLSILLSLLPAIQTAAQISPLQVEANAGVWLPSADLVGARGVEGPPSVDASFGVHFALTRGKIGYLLGFTENRFGCRQGACDTEASFVSTAWDLGLRISLRETGFIPWLRFNGTSAVVQAHLGAPGAVIVEESDRGWGFEAGAGLLIPLGTQFAVSPGIRYGRIDVDYPSRGKLETRYMVVDLGLVLGF